MRIGVPRQKWSANFMTRQDPSWGCWNARLQTRIRGSMLHMLAPNSGLHLSLVWYPVPCILYGEHDGIGDAGGGKGGGRKGTLLLLTICSIEYGGIRDEHVCYMAWKAISTHHPSRNARSVLIHRGTKSERSADSSQSTGLPNLITFGFRASAHKGGFPQTDYTWPLTPDHVSAIVLPLGVIS